MEHYFTEAGVVDGEDSLRAPVGEPEAAVVPARGFADGEVAVRAAAKSAQLDLGF